jgi:hypothetical protein
MAFISPCFGLGLDELHKARDQRGHDREEGLRRSVLPLPHRGRRTRWRRRGRGARVGELQRFERIDEAGAEIVVG